MGGREINRAAFDLLNLPPLAAPFDRPVKHCCEVGAVHAGSCHRT